MSAPHPRGDEFYCVLRGLGTVIDPGAGSARPGDDIVERQQGRLAVEVRSGDFIDSTEKVIGRNHRHRCLRIEGMRASPDVSAAGRSNATSTVPSRTAAAASAAATACNCSRTSGWRSAQTRAHFAGVPPGTYPRVRDCGVTASGYR